MIAHGHSLRNDFTGLAYPANDVDETGDFVFLEVSPGYFKVVLKHGLDGFMVGWFHGVFKGYAMLAKVCFSVFYEIQLIG